MPKALKIVVWVLVFVVAIGAGVYQASKSNPFPPGVEDPGARPHQSPRHSSPSPTSTVANVRMRITSTHVLHVGGSCTSEWQVAGTLSIDANGRASGQGKATLIGRARCDFRQSQVQTDAIKLRIDGKTVGGRLRLTLSEAGRSPVGSQDLGGLPNTLALIHPEVRPTGGSASARASKADGDLGRYESTTQIRLWLQ
jgi:hypothetical protein